MKVIVIVYNAHEQVYSSDSFGSDSGEDGPHAVNVSTIATIGLQSGWSPFDMSRCDDALEWQ